MMMRVLQNHPLRSKYPLKWCPENFPSGRFPPGEFPPGSGLGFGLGLD